MTRCWHQPVDLAMLERINPSDMIARLGFVYTEVRDQALLGELPVDERTTQPYGLLHGGVSCVVAESMGSMAANLCVDRNRYACVGIEINASHLAGASTGPIVARCEPIRIGSRIHVWQTDLFGPDERHVCVSRLTVAVIDAPNRS